jgi:CHASE3 domain sensor protein
MDKTFRILLTLFVIVGALLIGIVIVAIGNTNRAIRAAAWVNHTHAYINEIDATLGSLREAESAVNAFLLNGDPANSSHYGRAFAELAEHLTVAQALAAADPVEAKAVAELDAMLRYRAERARTLIAAHRANDPATVEATLAGDTDEINFVTIEQAARNIRLRQTQLLNERDQTAFQQDQLARVTLYLGALFSVLILVAASWFIRDNLNARRQAHQLLAESNEQLEIKVQARTADLESVNKKLRAENIESRWSNQALEHPFSSSPKPSKYHGSTRLPYAPPTGRVSS